MSELTLALARRLSHEHFVSGEDLAQALDRLARGLGESRDWLAVVMTGSGVATSMESAWVAVRPALVTSTVTPWLLRPPNRPRLCQNQCQLRWKTRRKI